jgi:hypothetical protein
MKPHPTADAPASRRESGASDQTRPSSRQFWIDGLELHAHRQWSRYAKQFRDNESLAANQ